MSTRLQSRRRRLRAWWRQGRTSTTSRSRCGKRRCCVKRHLHAPCHGPQNEVLAETEMMVPDTAKRLSAAVDGLGDYIVSGPAPPPCPAPLLHNPPPCRTPTLMP